MINYYIPTFVIDGNNVILTFGNKNPSIEAIIKLKYLLENYGHVYIILSRELKYRIKNKSQLKKLCDYDNVFVAPANTDVDKYILKISQELDAFIISNDSFRQYKNNYSEELEKRFTFMLIKDPSNNIKVILPWIHDFEVIKIDKEPIYST